MPCILTCEFLREKRRDSTASQLHTAFIKCWWPNNGFKYNQKIVESDTNPVSIAKGEMWEAFYSSIGKTTHFQFSKNSAEIFLRQCICRNRITIVNFLQYLCKCGIVV
jgi:hypothetical protein